jgi:hypothetical protein
VARISWRKSKSCGNGECVEVAQESGVILVRNSQRPGQILEFTDSEWIAFAAGLKAGEFDDLG